MGKTFEAVTKETVDFRTKGDGEALETYDPRTTRIGRNYFREPPESNLLQSLGLPALTRLWKLEPRPTLITPEIFDTRLTPENEKKEKLVPYSMTGGLFLADMGQSYVPEMNGKAVYQLNYRWPRLNPVYPMTRLVDEIVQIGEGIYLGQLVFATKHYALATFDTDRTAHQLGEDYVHHDSSVIDYGYQNNGFFLMMDPDYSERIYAKEAFYPMRPRLGETGYVELGFDQQDAAQAPIEAAGTANGISDWVSGWKTDEQLREKFTTLILEQSPKTGDMEDVHKLLHDGESVLQMLQRISEEISAQTTMEDNLRHFEKLNHLFRCGVAPNVENGLFQRYKDDAYNMRLNGEEKRYWYGKEEPCTGIDYYHGANLNLHCGFRENFQPEANIKFDDGSLFPSQLANRLVSGEANDPNILNMAWHSIGKYLFPWAGKSFEKISGRKLSMLLDESDDLADRYPDRFHELKFHLASAPHYQALLKNQENYWSKEGINAAHLKNGAWDKGMSEEDKTFWDKEAEDHWVFGNNLQDKRILMADPLMRIVDMNYHELDPFFKAAVEDGPSPIARQGYIFLGVSGRESILPMNNGEETKKKVFQFQYRYPMIGGPAPIGYCLDELVEVADGLFLGQLIYSTALDLTFHSSVDPDKYKYQLFGYFLLLDDEWQRHRLAIGLDTWQ